MKHIRLIENNTTQQQHLFLDLSSLDFLKYINKLSSEVFLPFETDVCSFFIQVFKL